MPRFLVWPAGRCARKSLSVIRRRNAFCMGDAVHRRPDQTTSGVSHGHVQSPHGSDRIRVGLGNIGEWPVDLESQLRRRF